MHVQWYGQSAFVLNGGAITVAIDPFGGSVGALCRQGPAVRLPPDRRPVQAQLLLVTHEHADHNGVEAIGGDPAVSAPPRAAWTRRSAR